MSGASGAVLALGLGNPLRGDDGVGPRVIEALRQLERGAPGTLPPGTRLIAAEAPSLDLLGLIGEAPALLLVDAVELGGRPGALVVRRDAAAASLLRDGEAGDLLTAARLTGCHPTRLVLVGVEVASTGSAPGLSAPVEAVVPAAIRLARRELTRLARPVDETRAARVQAREPSPEGVCA